jgi:beta-lactamase class D
VRELMVAEKSPRGVLRGKTGTQWDPKWKRTALGWYVGWVDHAGRTYLFATNISGGQEPTGATARRITREILTGRGWL